MTTKTDIKSRLKRSATQTSKKEDLKEPRQSRRLGPSARARKLQAAVGGEIIAGSSGEYLLIKSAHDASYRHGSVSLKNSLSTRYSLSHVITGAGEESIKIGNLLFYDTETTGLSGAGALAFLAGVGSFTERGFETRQYLMPDFADETALLEGLLTEFGEHSVIVSYNGKSFDLPLTTDRLILNRVARKVPHAEHLDLLYTVRSLFKRRIGSCSLGNVESEIFDYRREHDIPGYLVPAVYFDWAHEDKTDELGAVLDHNRQDIVSLALLLAVISEIHDSSGETLVEPLDVYSYMRRLELSGQRQRACAVGRDRGRELNKLGSAEIDFRRAMIFKRAGDFSAAISIWENLDNKTDSISQLARLELAKWHEHRGKNLTQALLLTETGLSHCQGRSPERAAWRRRQVRLKKRLARINLIR